MNKSIIRKISSILLVCALIFSNLIVVTPIMASATGKVSINKKTASIKVRSSVHLKLNNASGTIKWKSSNSKVAKVSESGIVTGIKAGTARITAKTNGKSYSCKVTVKYPSIEYISYYDCHYEEFADGGHRQAITFTMKDKKKKEYPVPATVYTKIVNKDNVLVYDAITDITEDWYCTYGANNDNYSAIIYLTGESMKATKYSTATLYLRVEVEGQKNVFEVEIPVCHLPVKEK